MGARHIIDYVQNNVEDGRVLGNTEDNVTAFGLTRFRWQQVVKVVTRCGEEG